MRFLLLASRGVSHVRTTLPFRIWFPLLHSHFGGAPAALGGTTVPHWILLSLRSIWTVSPGLVPKTAMCQRTPVRPDFSAVSRSRIKSSKLGGTHLVKLMGFEHFFSGTAQDREIGWAKFFKFSKKRKNGRPTV